MWVVALAFAGAFGVLFVLFRVSNRAPKGVTLALGAGILGLSYILDPGTSRSMVVGMVTLRILGIAAAVLGVTDLLRRRTSSGDDSGSNLG
jgi:hypothetical protein